MRVNENRFKLKRLDCREIYLNFVTEFDQSECAILTDDFERGGFERIEQLVCSWFVRAELVCAGRTGFCCGGVHDRLVVKLYGALRTTQSDFLFGDRQIKLIPHKIACNSEKQKADRNRQKNCMRFCAWRSPNKKSDWVGQRV